MTRIIEVVDYDPNWVAAFEKEAATLNAIFGDRLLAVHHIGSTSVRGLAAKPVIDILVVLDDTKDINSFDAAMEAVGYRVRGESTSWHSATTCAHIRTKQQLMES
jgi:GrpB-like predicted nucleotidyltransferase (UPF0157 family)